MENIQNKWTSDIKQPPSLAENNYEPELKLRNHQSPQTMLIELPFLHPSVSGLQSVGFKKCLLHVFIQILMWISRALNRCS